MEEVDYLASVYFGEKEIKNERERKHLRRLYEYVHLLNPPEEKPLTISYYTLIDLCGVIPENIENRYDIIKSILLRTKLLPKNFDESELKKRIEYATKFVRDMGSEKKEKIELKDVEKKTLRVFEEKLKEEMDSEEIQTLIFETAKENGIKPGDFFRVIYRVILGVDQGPRAGSLIKLIGVKKVKEIISEYR